MEIKFTINLREDDYYELSTRGLITQAYSCKDAMLWLDKINCLSDRKENYNQEQSTFDIETSYTIDDKISTTLMLKWPNLFSLTKDYEQVSIVN